MKLAGVVKEKQVLHINGSDDVVCGILENRKTGVPVLPVEGEEFFIGAVHVRKSHMDSGDHNIPGHRVAQVYHVVDHFFLVRFDHAVLMADVHDGTQVFLGNALILVLGINVEQGQDTHGQSVDQEDHRRHKLHESADDGRVDQSHAVGVDGGGSLGGDLAEKQDQYG